MNKQDLKTCAKEKIARLQITEEEERIKREYER